VKLLVTGAGGFIGARACRFFSDRGHEVRSFSRKGSVAQALPVSGELFSRASIERALQSVDAVLHAAGLAHSRGVSQTALDQINVEWPVTIAEAASSAGIPFVFLSSSKVYGETGHFSESSSPAPADAYARAKTQAEEGIVRAGGTYIILRPPPVYGAGSKGSLGFLIEAVKRGWPLPVGRISSLRSYVTVENLLGGVNRLLSTSARGIWNISDDSDIALADLARMIARIAGVKDRSFSMPIRLLRILTAARPGAFEKIAGTFTLDISRIKTAGYAPLQDMAAGLREAVDAGSGKNLSVSHPEKI
jgi:nucleoside-diphosphate-sugar epimerase